MPFPAKVSPQSRRKKLILCIDDHQPGVRARKLILEAAGYRVLTANSGTIGLRLLRRHRVHFVVLDYRMPQMDGEASDVLSAVDVFVSKGQPPAVLLQHLAALAESGL